MTHPKLTEWKELCEKTKDIVVLRESGDPETTREFGEWMIVAREALPKLISALEISVGALERYRTGGAFVYDRETRGEICFNSEYSCKTADETLKAIEECLE